MKRTSVLDLNAGDDEMVSFTHFKRRCVNLGNNIDQYLDKDDPLLSEEHTTFRFIVENILFYNDYLCERNPNSKSLRDLWLSIGRLENIKYSPYHQEPVTLEDNAGYYLRPVACNCPLYSQTLRPILFPENIEGYFIQPNVCRSLWTSDTFQVYDANGDDGLDDDAIFGVTCDGRFVVSDAIGPAPFGALIDKELTNECEVNVYQIYIAKDDDARISLFYLFPLSEGHWDWEFNRDVRDFLRSHGLLNHWH